MSKKKLIILISSFVAIGITTGFAAYEGTKETVTLTMNGEEQQIRTHANTVSEILEAYEINVRSEDYISPSAETKVIDDMKIIWEAAKPIQLVIGDNNTTIWTTAKTVEEFIQNQNITITEYDKVQPDLDTALAENMKVRVETAFQLTLTIGGEQQQVWSTSTTVADFLKQQQVTLNELDRVEPKLNEPVTKDSIVKVTRVEKVTDVVEESVDYAVVTKQDSSLERGSSRVLAQGYEGIVAKHYEVMLENGEEVSRELIKTETVKESSDRIVAVGIKIIPQQVSRSNENVADEFYVESTAYTAYCTGCSGVTTTGINLRANPDMKVIAVDPTVIPLGTKVYVDGYGYAIAGDIGSAIKGYKIDVFFPDKLTAYRWGRRKDVKIKILE